MPTPVLHVIAGPNGAGKSTFQRSVLAPSTLEFVNADHIAAQRWPDAEAAHAYDAASLAEQRRAELLDEHTSFVAETVFSHESKVELLRRASEAGYIVVLHVILVSEALAVARVEHLVANGGHFVPEDKIRSRHRRLWSHVARAAGIADETIVYDNSSATNPYKVVAAYRSGSPVRQPTWPPWAPTELVNL
ncbi:zeta toxin family protein [Candidatus Poriferisodalis sp.]|uniref:zeta toxin family protein n=1 Tax=Candidatus Poriferisodalis sp. TaxID=3101277 RepID=UPI003B528221